MTPTQRLVLKLYLEQIEQTEKHMAELEKSLAAAQSAEQDAIVRLCGHPGISTLAAQQIIAEVGPRAAAFASANQLASWVGISPGSHESAGVSSSNRCPHGNRMLRRVLSQIAWAAIVAKGSEPQRRYRHWLAKHFSPPKVAWAVAHYILRVIWHMRVSVGSVSGQDFCPAAGPPPVQSGKQQFTPFLTTPCSALFVRFPFPQSRRPELALFVPFRRFPPAWHLISAASRLASFFKMLRPN